MIRALIVDDEEKNITNLAFLLQQDCEGIEVAGHARSASEARSWLRVNKVDVIFLDINMPIESGFDLLDSIPQRDFQVVFVTAYDEYALRAIKASALDYLLKPVKIEELQQAVQKIKRELSNPASGEKNTELLKNLLLSVHKKAMPVKIALPHLGGISFIEVIDIVSLQADSNYTVIHLKNMQKHVITKTLKDFEEIMDPMQFARIHKSTIVNLNYVKEYTTTDGGVVKMADGTQWSISRRQLDSFLEKIKNTSLMFGK
ncbi:MAG: DNA-binding response regulator [Flaviaesturariibacter sp.]|nr:DNA-binding response regulator [Flaviaesturariibacter sp.]